MSIRIDVYGPICSFGIISVTITGNAVSVTNLKNEATVKQQKKPIAPSSREKGKSIHTPMVDIKSKFFVENFLYANAKNKLPAKVAICKIKFTYDEVVSFKMLIDNAIVVITLNMPIAKPRAKFGINNTYVFLFLKTAKKSFFSLFSLIVSAFFTRIDAHTMLDRIKHTIAITKKADVVFIYENFDKRRE